MKVSVATRVTQIAGQPLAAQPKIINWDSSSDRKWLMNHMHHCMMNQKQIILTPESVRTHPKGL